MPRVYYKRNVDVCGRNVHRRVECGGRYAFSIEIWHAEKFVGPREKQTQKEK